MFIRQKKNKSGVISIQILTKVKGKSKLVKTIGSSADPKIIKNLLLKAQNYIDHYGGQKTLGFEQFTTLRDVLQNITAHIVKLGQNFWVYQGKLTLYFSICQ